MKHNQALELHPHLSKLLDSLCFELAVNIPDENSLSLLEILDMRKADQINEQEFKQLYRDWLQSKNIYDIFTAKQVRTYPKHQFLSNPSLAKYINSENILQSLQLLNTIYNEYFYARKKPDRKLLLDTQELFNVLDTCGNIHLGLSDLFFLVGSLLINENASIPLNYQQFKPIFKKKIKDFCAVEGIVSLRCFKNYFLFKTSSSNHPTQLLIILDEIQRGLKKGESSRIKDDSIKLPDILSEAMLQWKSVARFNGILESKKKKFQIYQRIFIENQQIFFFNGKEDNILNVNYFIKKYGQSYVKSIDLDTPFLRQFGQIFNEILNDHLSVLAKISMSVGKNSKTSHVSMNSAYQTPSHHHHQTNPNPSPYQQFNPFKSALQSHKKSPTKVYGKERTPKKIKQSDSRKYNVTPTQKYSKISPMIKKNFGSTDKSRSNRSKSRNMTPTKSYNGGYSNLYPQTALVYKNSRKQGLQKDNVYEKLFFFRNKRVQSFDIVMKRLKGR